MDQMPSEADPLLQFQFIKSCSTDQLRYTCKVDKEKNQLFISFSDPMIKSSYRIKASILNPEFISSANIRVYMQNKANGQTIARGVGDTPLEVALIPTRSEGIFHLWGLDSIEEFDLAMHRNAFNSIQFGFSVSE